MTRFFTSDTHFSHRLLTKLRGFVPATTPREDITDDDLAAHDESIIAAWNAVVTPADTVWHLGDLSLLRPSAVARLLTRLNGEIRLVLGNHDTAHPLFGKKSVPAHAELLASGVSYATMAARVTLRDHDGNRLPVFLSHFPYVGDHLADGEERFPEWRLRDTGGILLHGHTHSAEVFSDTDPAEAPAAAPGPASSGPASFDSASPVSPGPLAAPRRWNRQIHVGWDAWFRPVAEEEIVDLIEQRRTESHRGQP